jgi:ABC-type multidrug transport system permease subunit
VFLKGWQVHGSSVWRGVFRLCAFDLLPLHGALVFICRAFLTTALFLLGLFACAFILGILVNILILSFGQKVEITAWMFAQLFMILCGIYYPVDILPKFFQYLALMVPITHFLEFFRQSYGFKGPYTVSFSSPVLP